MLNIGSGVLYFKGKFLNKIGIGSTLHDVEKQIGKWEEYLDTYILPDFPGICFEPADRDDVWL